MVTFQLFCIALLALAVVVGLVASIIKLHWSYWWRMVWGVGWRSVVLIAGIFLFFVVFFGAFGLYLW